MKLNSVIFAGTNTFAQIGVKQILKNQCEYYETITEPIDLIKSVTNQTTLVVFYLEKGSGFDKELLAQVQGLNQTHLLVITADYSKPVVKFLLNASVKGCLTDNCSMEEIQEAIEKVSTGEQFYCNSVLNNALGTPDEDNCFPSLLTERETEIVKLIANGKSSKKIAEELFVSIHTINTHRKNISKKIGAKGTSDIVLFAVNEGLKD